MIYSDKGTKITASSEKEAISKIISELSDKEIRRLRKGISLFLNSLKKD